MRSAEIARLVPAYLLFCLLLGGSSQDIRPNLVLQLLGIALILVAVLQGLPVQNGRAARGLLAIVLAVAVLLLLQIIPLPPAFWTRIPGRSSVAAAYALLGEPLPWLGVSLTPAATVESLLFLLPPLAILLGTTVLRPRDDGLALAVLLGALAGILLAALQVTGGERFHPYAITNGGAVGVFANRNFMGTLLLSAIPFAVAFLAESRRSGHSAWTARAMAGAALLLMLAGLALTRSIAATLLLVPVAVASFALLWKPSRGLTALLQGGAALLALTMLYVVVTRPVQEELTSGTNVSLVSRTSIWKQSAQIIADTFPAGTGVGSFPSIYMTYEDPALVGRQFVNAAHNDYLQIVLETGAVGAVLIIALLGWWAMRVWTIWTSPAYRATARAATIASAVVILHSAVDYPLHTSAIAGLFASCLGMMARPPESRTRFDRHVVSHVTIG